ncbi:MAG: fumarate hydratase [Planctomycetes bacterium]|nr:fumarate hydratase [Planctomycetota bacterium]
MREIDAAEIGRAVEQCIEQASFTLGRAELDALTTAIAVEDNSLARDILGELIENASIAAAERRALCQDTGLAVVFLDIGQQVLVTGQPLEQTVNSAVAAAYTRLGLRKSVVAHPLERRNTGDNAPAILHTRLVPGDRATVRFAAKGGGCENMSAMAMLTPSADATAVADFVVKTVVQAGGKTCPPIIVGVGLGGNFERAAMLAKLALLRPLGRPSENPIDARLERDLLARINATGIGPMGLGGRTTALAVHVESAPCHIASLPVAVNIDCHSHRHAEISI